MLRLLTLALCCLLVACQSTTHYPSADRILLGEIITMDPEQPTAEAVAVKDGKIIAVGTHDEVWKHVGEWTSIVQMHEGIMLPGFIDPHSHFLQMVDVARWANVSSPPAGDVSNIEQLVGALKQLRDEREQQAGDWLVAWGYDSGRITDGRELTKDDLDRDFGDQPVMVIHVSGHGGVLNSAALRIVGIDESSEAPPGGIIRRKPNSREPDGFLMETAFLPAYLALPRPALEERLDALKEAQRSYAAQGITTLQEGATDEKGLALLDEANRRELLKLDIVAQPLWVDAAELIGRRDFRGYRGRLKLGGIKFIVDGSPQGKTALFSEPYLTGGPAGEEDWRGEPNISKDELELLVRHCAANDVRVYAHCNGDGAIDMLLDALDALPEGVVAERPVIIHSQFVRPDQLERYVELGCTPSYFTNHAYYWGDVHRRNLGEERAAFLSPCATSKHMGIRFTNHTDFMVTPLNPLFTVLTASERRQRTSEVLGPDERISVYDALHAITVDAAYQCGEEDSKGSITVGKRADFVVLSANPLEREGAALLQIRTWQTYKDGVLVWELEGIPHPFVRRLREKWM